MKRLWVGLAIASWLGWTSPSRGQDVQIQVASPAASPVAAPPAGATPPPSATPPTATPPTAAPPTAAPPAATPPADGTAKPPGPAVPIKRGDKPKSDANPDELKVRPVDGKVSFQFQGQPWTALIDWYVEISGRTIDWRELPGDFLNIRTPKPYTIAETQDVLNRHLLARGYTILDDGEFLTVEKTDEINSSLVPRVSPEELHQFLPYSFVKTSFRLHRILATDAVKELESMKSKNGKLTALAGSNRIEAMDAAKNLLDIYTVLQQEGDTGTLKEFTLQHTRARDIVDKLYDLLGIERKQSGPMTPEQMQQQMAMEQMRAQQRMQQQQQPGGAPAEPPKETPVSFVVNETNNSIIAQAPPNKMLTITEAIKFLDIPSPRHDSLESRVGRIQTYRLTSLNPNEVVTILMQSGGMDPSTTLHVDKDSKSIVANASPWDHLIITKLIQKLDGSARNFKVIRLRRRRSDQVATTIETLMVGEKKEDSSRNRYSYWGYQPEEPKKDNDGFRVGADVEHNWLLLWCNDLEYDQVVDLLAELGEVTHNLGPNNTQRIIESLPGEDQDTFLQRVRAAFQELAPNDVELPEPLPAEEPNGRPGEEEPSDGNDDGEMLKSKVLSEEDAQREARDIPTQRKKQASGVSRFQTHLVQVTSRSARTEAKEGLDRDEAELAEEEEPLADEVKKGRSSQVRTEEVTEETNQRRRRTPPPIKVRRDARGRLVLESDDTAALDLFQELIDQMAPQDPGYTVFTLKYASATWVSVKLKDFFQEEDDKENNRFPYYYYFYGDDFGQNDKKNKKTGLGDQRKIKFISEMDTNTILVRNATPEQLKTVAELIKIYDIQEPQDSKKSRLTKTVQIKYGKARNIETTIKDVFRDLLSDTDKAFQQQQGEGREEGGRSRNRGGSSFFGGSDSSSSDFVSGVTFKGKISFGVDESSNLLIVTTEGETLMKIVLQMIDDLDKAARPSEVARVVSLPGGTSPEAMREVLNKLFGKPATPNGQEGQPNNGQPQPGQPAPQGQPQGQPNGKR